jgi:hypothetical protein
VSNLIKAWRGALRDKLTMTQAAWLPFSQSIAIGDFGEFKDDVFERRAHCSKWGVDVAAHATRTEESGYLEIVSGTTLTIGSGADATALGAKVTADVQFSADESFLFRAPALTTIEVTDPEAFGEEVYRQAKYAGDAPSLMRYLVYGLTVVRQGYFLGSASKGTSMGVAGGYDEVTRGAVEGTLRFERTSSDMVTVKHPGEGNYGDAAVVAFKVLSWSPNGKRVQVDANT